MSNKRTHVKGVLQCEVQHTSYESTADRTGKENLKSHRNTAKSVQ